MNRPIVRKDKPSVIYPPLEDVYVLRGAQSVAVETRHDFRLNLPRQRKARRRLQNARRAVVWWAHVYAAGGIPTEQ